MNAAGRGFELAVAYAKLWDRIYRVSGKVGGFAVVVSIAYVAVRVLWR